LKDLKGGLERRILAAQIPGMPAARSVGQQAGTGREAAEIIGKNDRPVGQRGVVDVEHQGWTRHLRRPLSKPVVGRRGGAR